MTDSERNPATEGTQATVEKGHERIEAAIKDHDDDAQGTFAKALDWFGTHPGAGVLVVVLVMLAIFATTLIIILSPAENLNALKPAASGQVEEPKK